MRLTLASLTSIPRRIFYAYTASRPYRMIYGSRVGVLVWNKTRNHYLYPQGAPYAICVPNLKRPVWLRAGTSDLDVFRQVFLSGEFDFPTPAQPRLIVDAGANIGLVSVVFASRFPNCQVVAIEADESNFALLNRNTSEYSNIRAVHAALWSHDTTVRVSNPSAAHWARQVEESIDSSEAAVSTTTIPRILAESHAEMIDLLKIDIEGAELEILSTAATWIDRIGTLAIELHDRLRPGCTGALEALLGNRLVQETRSGEYRVFQFRPQA